MKNIWISGSINSMKSTVLKILNKRLKMVGIELGSFSEFVNQFSFGFRIDTKNLTPEETVNKIIYCLEKKTT